MTNPHKPNPDHATTDPRAAAKQEQIHRDHDRLEESARRVDASVQTTVDDDNARKVESARENADAARRSARRVEESVRDDHDRDRH